MARVPVVEMVYVVVAVYPQERMGGERKVVVVISTLSGAESMLIERSWLVRVSTPKRVQYSRDPRLSLSVGALQKEGEMAAWVVGSASRRRVPFEIQLEMWPRAVSKVMEKLDPLMIDLARAVSTLRVETVDGVKVDTRVGSAVEI